MVVPAVVLMLTSDAAVPSAARGSAIAPASRAPVTIARLPLRSLRAARAPIGDCRLVPSEAPRPWTPDKDVIGPAAGGCWGQAVTMTAASSERLPAMRQRYDSADDNPRMRVAMLALPYLRAAYGGGGMMVALTGRLALARGNRPAMRLDVAHGRAGATSYVIAPEPRGLMLGRPDRFQ